MKRFFRVGRTLLSGIMSCRTGVSGLLLPAILMGCSSDKHASGAATGLNRNDADELNAQHARFEQGKDPALRPETHFAAGQFAESRGDVRQAMGQYRSALRIKSDHQPSLYRLGVLHTQSREFDFAIAAWQDYVRATGGDPSAYANLGFCLEQAGRIKDAAAAYEKGLEKNPKTQACRVNYGLMLARSGRVDEALAQWREVLSEAQAQYNLGSVYELQGKKKQAREAYRQAAELDPNLTAAKTRLSAL